MPGYKKHLFGGACFYAIIIYVLRASKACNPSLSTLLEWLAWTLAGSLFPDVDIKSKGQKLFYSLLFLVLIALALFERFKLIAILSCCCMTPLLVHHRGLFHRIWFIVGLPLLLASLAGNWMPAYKNAFLYDALFFILGAVSHLWLDLGVFRMFRL